MRIWRETGEIITEDEYARRETALWESQNRRLDSLSLVNNAIAHLDREGVARFPTDRRALARRRWRHRLWVATPALIFAVVIVVLMILFYSGPAPCEPYMNC